MTLEQFNRLNVGDKVKTFSKHPKKRYDGITCVVIDKDYCDAHIRKGIVVVEPIKGQVWTMKDQHPWTGLFNGRKLTSNQRVYDCRFLTIVSKKVKVRRAP